MGTIAVSNLGKAYKQYPTRWSRLVEWLTPGNRPLHRLKWVLRDISFSLRSGEAVGIIGINGAGKSTLLKLITGTTSPTTGNVALGGRVAALLELGMGFHQEFTGRENAYMAGQLLGYSAEEMARRLPEIVAFAEIEEYIDQPVRVYSSGMQMRLAFSVATATRPDILIVDEALSVGDTYFSHKSMQRIRTFKEQGTTLLFVSHDPAAVKSLCDRALLLDSGTLIREGTPDSVLDYYNAMIARREKAAEIWQTEATHGRAVTRSGSGAVRISAVELMDEQQEPARAFRVGSVGILRCELRIEEDVEDVTVGMIVRDRLGNDVFGTNTYNLQKAVLGPVHAGSVILATFRIRLDLGCGHYALTVAAHSGETHVSNNYDWWDNALVFQVIPNEGPKFIGLCALDVEAEVRLVDVGANAGLFNASCSRGHAG